MINTITFFNRLTALNQTLCSQIQEHLKDAFCHLYYFLSNEMKMQSTNYKPYKYADDMALVALLWKDCIDY